MKIRNPKSETNPRQSIQMAPNQEGPKNGRLHVSIISISDLFRISDFGFRILRFRRCACQFPVSWWVFAALDPTLQPTRALHVADCSN